MPPILLWRNLKGLSPLHPFDFYTFESVRVERLCHIGHLKVNTQTKTGLDAFFEHAWNIEGTKKVEKITI